MMNKQEMKEALERLDALAVNYRIQIAKGCLSCWQFQHGTTCGRYNAPVPAEFQKQGCDEWRFDDIPF